MKYVYMLQSEAAPNRHYVGCTVDLKKRMNDHNKGLSPHTKKFAPWRMVAYVAFINPEKANKFETYLKAASGRAFAKRHF